MPETITSIPGASGFQVSPDGSRLRVRHERRSIETEPGVCRERGRHRRAPADRRSGGRGSRSLERRGESGRLVLRRRVHHVRWQLDPADRSRRKGPVRSSGRRDRFGRELVSPERTSGPSLRNVPQSGWATHRAGDSARRRFIPSRYHPGQQQGRLRRRHHRLRHRLLRWLQEHRLQERPAASRSDRRTHEAVRSSARARRQSEDGNELADPGVVEFVERSFGDSIDLVARDHPVVFTFPAVDGVAVSGRLMGSGSPSPVSTLHRSTALSLTPTYGSCVWMAPGSDASTHFGWICGWIGSLTRAGRRTGVRSLSWTSAPRAALPGPTTLRSASGSSTCGPGRSRTSLHPSPYPT